MLSVSFSLILIFFGFLFFVVGLVLISKRASRTTRFWFIYEPHQIMSPSLENFKGCLFGPYKDKETAENVLASLSGEIHPKSEIFYEEL